MKVTVVNFTDSELEVVVEGEGNTLLNVLRDILLDDEKVAFASYVNEHPMRLRPHLVLRTKGKNALETLTEASSKMASLAEEFNKKFTDVVKNQK
nr:DNA-directed RNA polymerase subunit L [Candidatus Njordarchaeota archaeon]